MHGEVEDDGQDGEDEAGGHVLFDGGLGDGFEGGEADGCGHEFAAAEHDAGVEVFVPGEEEGDNGDCGEAGRGEGQDDAPEGAQFGAAVDDGGVEDFVGDVVEDALEDPDADGEDEGGVDEGE